MTRTAAPSSLWEAPSSLGSGRRAGGGPCLHRQHRHLLNTTYSCTEETAVHLHSSIFTVNSSQFIKYRLTGLNTHPELGLIRYMATCHFHWKLSELGIRILGQSWPFSRQIPYILPTAASYSCVNPAGVITTKSACVTAV